MQLDGLQRSILALSFALGVYTLVVTPLYSIFINPSICNLSPSTCVNGVKITGGEAPFVFFPALVVIPLLIRKGGKGMNLGVIGLAGLLALFDLAGFSRGAFVQGISFASSPGCYLFAGNCIDHNLFHLSQLPFYAAILILGYVEHQKLKDRGRGLAQGENRKEALQKVGSRV